MKIGIIVAMDKEFAQLRVLLDKEQTETRNGKTFVRGSIGENQLIMQQCGIGKVTALLEPSK